MDPWGVHQKSWHLFLAVITVWQVLTVCGILMECTNEYVRWRGHSLWFLWIFMYSCLPIRASENYWAETAFRSFMGAVGTHGLPSRVRADYGRENTLGISRRGPGWGSFITGKSERIKCLWRMYSLHVPHLLYWRRLFPDNNNCLHSVSATNKFPIGSILASLLPWTEHNMSPFQLWMRGMLQGTSDLEDASWVF